MQRYTKIYTLQREKWNILRENPYFQTVFPYQRLFFSKKYTTFARKIDCFPTHGWHYLYQEFTIHWIIKYE